ncbi:MAG TPA: hypothetical protein VII98_06140 [Solirubrobacteraceae bacterium]
MSARRPLAAGVAAAGVLLGGCGVAAPDLFVLHRSGSIPGARLTLLVNDGGTVRCNGGPAKTITSAQLIRARGAVDDLKGKPNTPGPATLATQLPAGPGSILRYVVRDEDGTVAFSDTSAHQPKVFFQLAALTRELAQKVCGLPR